MQLVKPNLIIKTSFKTIQSIGNKISVLNLDLFNQFFLPELRQRNRVMEDQRDDKRTDGQKDGWTPDN